MQGDDPKGFEIYSYNKGQQDALFLKLILVKNSTCFGHNCCPSSGVLILYSQQTGVCHIIYVDPLLARSGLNARLDQNLL